MVSHLCTYSEAVFGRNDLGGLRQYLVGLTLYVAEPWYDYSEPIRPQSARTEKFLTLTVENSTWKAYAVTGRTKAVPYRIPAELIVPGKLPTRLW